MVPRSSLQDDVRCDFVPGRGGYQGIQRGPCPPLGGLGKEKQKNTEYRRTKTQFCFCFFFCMQIGLCFCFCFCLMLLPLEEGKEKQRNEHRRIRRPSSAFAFFFLRAGRFVCPWIEGGLKYCMPYQHPYSRRGIRNRTQAYKALPKDQYAFSPVPVRYGKRQGPPGDPGGFHFLTLPWLA